MGLGHAGLRFLDDLLPLRIELPRQRHGEILALPLEIALAFAQRKLLPARLLQLAGLLRDLMPHRREVVRQLPLGLGQGLLQYALPIGLERPLERFAEAPLLFRQVVLELPLERILDVRAERFRERDLLSAG